MGCQIGESSRLVSSDKKELWYNRDMKEITGYDLRNDAVLHQFLHEAYVNNEDVLIPKHLLKDFVELGCRLAIAKASPFSK